MLAALLLSMCPSEASDPDAGARLVMFYPVKELPVWSAGGDFDPKILIKLLESAVTNSQAANNKQVRITKGTTGAELVIVADVEMHEKVWDILAGMRGSEADERPDFKNLLRRQHAEAIHQDKMQLRVYRMEREQLERRRRMSLRDQPFDIP